MLNLEPLWSLVNPLSCRLWLPDITGLEIKVEEEFMASVLWPKQLETGLFLQRPSKCCLGLWRDAWDP